MKYITGKATVSFVIGYREIFEQAKDKPDLLKPLIGADNIVQVS